MNVLEVFINEVIRQGYIRITSKIKYEIVFKEEIFTNGGDICYGECRPDQKQIVIQQKLLKPKNKVKLLKTIYHEMIHAMNFENPGPNITERQTRKIEEGFYRIYRLNNI